MIDRLHRPFTHQRVNDSPTLLKQAVGEEDGRDAYRMLLLLDVQDGPVLEGPLHDVRLGRSSLHVV